MHTTSTTSMYSIVEDRTALGGYIRSTGRLVDLPVVDLLFEYYYGRSTTIHSTESTHGVLMQVMGIILVEERSTGT